MLSALSQVNTRRMWFVPRLSVWGTSGWGEIDYLVIEQVDETDSILFGTVGMGDSSQLVMFEELMDFRGNALPATIKNPRVLVRPKGEQTAFIVGDELTSGFKIARQVDAGGPVTVDLLVVELGD